MKLSQNDTGRAFEYGIAVAFSEHLPASLKISKQLTLAKECFERCLLDEQRHIVLASKEAVAFLTAHDNRLSDTDCIVYLQSDQRGQVGDVRDVIVENTCANRRFSTWNFST